MCKQRQFINMNFAAIFLCVAMLARAMDATLLSAMDVIVVEQPDGSFMSSPFHVRLSQNFIGSSLKHIHIKVNDEPVNIRMEIGANGMSSEQIKSLNLKTGINEMEFSLGSIKCKCNVFRWHHTDKLIVSDIDGTITRNEELGLIISMFGKDWTQPGVAELFTKIEQNGYKFLYLTARPISYSSSTREYLRKIQQGSAKMPEGPVLLNPSSMIMAIHRRYIERLPEVSKIKSLNEVKAMFPENPFFSGYGNRINDEKAYSTAGILKNRIFIINPSGKVKNSLSGSSSTYRNMVHIVNHLYPPVINNN